MYDRSSSRNYVSEFRLYNPLSCVACLSLSRQYPASIAPALFWRFPIYDHEFMPACMRKGEPRTMSAVEIVDPTLKGVSHDEYAMFDQIMTLVMFCMIVI